MNLNKTLYH